MSGPRRHVPLDACPGDAEAAAEDGGEGSGLDGGEPCGVDTATDAAGVWLVVRP
jgi:hypothetical protein